MSRNTRLSGTPWSALVLIAAVAAIAPIPGTAQAQVPPLPRIDDAMTAICNHAARNSRCQLDGREMTYWISFQSAVDGRHWYTVVATAADHLSADEGRDDTSPTPRGVRISQVTFEAVNGRWKQIARQTSFGSVFTNNSGNPTSMNDSSGRTFVLDIPGAVIVGHPISQMVNEGIALPDRAGNSPAWPTNRCEEHGLETAPLGRAAFYS